MTMDTGPSPALTHAAIADIAPEAWNLCVDADHPLLRHAHLAAVEASGGATPGTGFTPRHVTLHDAAGRMIGAAPAWLKTHFRGELGIDLGLAMARQRQCRPCYPKPQVARIASAAEAQALAAQVSRSRKATPARGGAARSFDDLLGAMLSRGGPRSAANAAAWPRRG